MRLRLLKYFLNKSSTCKQGLTSQLGTLPSRGLTAELSLSLFIQQSGLDGHQMDLPARLNYSGNANHQGIETSKTRPGSQPLNHLALTLFSSALLWNIPLAPRVMVNICDLILPRGRCRRKGAECLGTGERVMCRSGPGGRGHQKDSCSEYQ